MTPCLMTTCLPPDQWTLTRIPAGPGDLKPWMNLLDQRTYRLENPDNPAQTLWCYCDKRPTPDGRGKWERRYGASQDANSIICELAQGDFHTNILAKIFRLATRRKP